MKSQFPRSNGLAVLMVSLLSAASVSAATLTFQTFNPTPGANDIFNFLGANTDANNVNGGDDAATYVSFDRPTQGQTFVTGTNAGGYQIRAVWLRHVSYGPTYWYMPPGGTFIIRVTDPGQTSTAGFVLDSETYTTTGTEPNTLQTTWGGNDIGGTGTGTWLRFALAAPITLSSNKVYGFDVTSQSSNGGFGVNPFLETDGTNGDAYAGGAAYSSGSGGVPGLDLTPAANGVADHAFMVEMVGQAIPVTFVTQPANQMVLQGATAGFSTAVSGTAPFAYQWYFNTNTLLSGQTNSALSLASVTTNLVGTYSVVVTNDAGSRTSSVARLSVILPSVTTNFNFSAGSGTILDQNGIGTGFSARLAGTGAAIPSNDPNLLLDTVNGVLNITSPSCDFNGQLAMDSAEAAGFNLSAIGFTGTQDFTVTGSFTNLPIGTYVNYDQVGIFAGTTTTNFVRGGLIFNSDFANLSSYGVGNQNGGDIGIATAAAPPANMVVTIARSGGVWSLSVNGRNVTPNASLTYLNTTNDMTVGVFALDTSGTHNTTSITTFSASLFTGPKLNVAKAGSNLTFSWNVISAGLQSSTNLADPNGWTPVTGATASPYVIPVPTSGSRFYRIAP